MAKKISELPGSNFYTGDETIVMVQDGTTKAGSLDLLANYLSGALLADSELAELSGDWESTYTTVSANSADWFGVDYDDTWLISPSANWESTYTTVSANSADWFNDSIGGTIQGTGINTLNIRATDEGQVAGLSRGEGSVDLQTSRETETQVASGTNSVIAGGKSNQANGAQDAIGGGYNNATFDPMGFNNVIGGGSNSYIIGYTNSIGGGTNNSIIGYANTIPGGTNNIIRANKSFAAGSTASALHDGVFIFSDSTTTTAFSSVQANSVNFKALGGLRLVDGNEAVGKVLTCTDADGTGLWALPEEVISYDDSLLQSTSGNWDTTYTTVSSNSASWVGGGNDSDTTIQNLSALGSHTAPNPLVIDLTQGLNVEGWLTANVSLQLSGAEAGQSGLITLGTGNAHDGVGFTVDFFLDNNTATSHVDDGHTVMTGDLADFATAPGVGEFNFGTIGWYYTGSEYFLYVSEVKVYTDSIQPVGGAPSGSIAYDTSCQLNVTGTLSPDATGVYTEAGTLNGEKYYTTDGYFIWNDGNGAWYLDNGTAVGGVGASSTWRNAAFFQVDGTSYTPTAGASGTATATKVAKVQTSGTHTPDTTGVFVEQGTFNGEKYYSNQAGDFFIWFDTSGFQWKIDNADAVGGGAGATAKWAANTAFGTVDDTYVVNAPPLASGTVTVSLVAC